MRWFTKAVAFVVAINALAACERRIPVERKPVSDSSATGRLTGTERPKELVVGLTPFLPEAQLRHEFDPLVAYLAEEIGVPTTLHVASNYSEMAVLVDQFAIHIAVFTPFAYVEAKKTRPDLVALVTQIAEGTSSYAAYIIAREGSGISNLADLKGKRFAFVDRQSTSGYLYPLAFLRNRGLDPNTFFASMVFAGNHGRVIEMVLAGEADGGAIYSTALRVARAGKIGAKRLRIVEKTGRIPYDVYCASPRLDAQLAGDVRRALLSLSTRTPRGRRILSGLTAINGFAPARDETYDDVRRVAKLVGDMVVGETKPPPE